MDPLFLLLHTGIMAGVTYLVRMLPLVVFRKKINNVFMRSFLYYMPFAVLAAMTIPAIFDSTASVWSAAAGLVIALILALFERSLLTVAVCACCGVFVTEAVLRLIG